MEILYILVPSVAIPLAIALLFFFICVCRNNQKAAAPPVQRQPKHVRGQNVEMSMLNAYKPKVKWQCTAAFILSASGESKLLTLPSLEIKRYRIRFLRARGRFQVSVHL